MLQDGSYSTPIFSLLLDDTIYIFGQTTAFTTMSGIITVDLMKKFKMIKPENKLIVPLTESKVSAIDALFNLRTETGSRNLCIFYLMLDAGLRSSEMLNLQITNVQFNDDLIFASQGKGSKDRIIPLSPHLATQKYL